MDLPAETNQNHRGSTLPALVMPQNFPEQQWRNLDEKIDSLRRDIMAEIKSVAILLYQTREQVARIEISAAEHKEWAEEQALKINSLEEQNIERRLQIIEQQFKLNDQKNRLDWWGFIIMAVCTAAGFLLKSLTDWIGVGR